jgi:NDP-sugar pyrophosphorylase family protein
MSPRNRLENATGIVLAGTHPWTRTPFDRLPPRPLLPVAHRPLLSYALSWLRDGGIRHAAVCANRETQVLESRLHHHVPHGLRVSYHEDDMPRGAAGAVRDAADGSDAEILVVADGTAIPNVELSDVLAAHQATRAAVTVVSYLERGRHGKPPLHVPTGIYVFNRQALASVPRRGFFDIKENLIPQLHRAHERISAYTAEHPSPRVLDASSYRAVNEWMVEHLVTSREVPEGYVLSGSCLIHRDAEIARDTTFVGPVLVGPGVRIASGAVIVGPTSIGRDVAVNAGVLVSRSAIWRRCVLHEHAVADRCIVADGSVIPAGAQVFHRIMANRPWGESEAVPEVSRSSLQQGPSFDLLRRMSRVLLGNAGWSRSPAAQ